MILYYERVQLPQSELQRLCKPDVFCGRDTAVGYEMLIKQKIGVFTQKVGQAERWTQTNLHTSVDQGNNDWGVGSR